MNPSFLLFFSLIGITVSIIVGGGGGGGYNDHSGHYSHSDSRDSSDSHEHRPHPHRPHPHRPNPPRELTKCPDSWMLFKRPQGNWCVGLYNALIDQLSAEQRCRALNATLTGLQTNEERMKLADAARALLLPTSVTDAAIWLGAKRKPECPRAGICLPKDTFNWTDGHTTGTDGFVYFPGEPNGKIDNAWG
ncbi:hypothetical protein CRE_13929 [Caenorhabditis remanei]|uniref:C-type lectin domain-containing protein n=1 Tax=Caenorhabditis remanei TaxID=31234 RepID=E3M8T3_CAERE|nr:hypothetical protein CRE_13929 [Caenorhabditis remanei]